MKRVIHISDLHFGKIRDELVDPLVKTINDLKPDLVCVSGDFTQRARRSQFADARQFLDRIEAPTLSVPGNHDTPLENLIERFFRPFRRYKKAINQDLEPTFSDDEIHVIGVNTVNRFAHQRGKVGSHTVKRICDTFQSKPDDRCRIVVLHHPLEHLTETDKRLTSGAAEAIEGLSECGADVLLCGHLHTTVTSPFTAAPGLLLVQAGTGLSSRLRGEENTFNLLTVEGAKLKIERFAAGETPEFAVDETRDFEFVDNAWVHQST